MAKYPFLYFGRVPDDWRDTTHFWQLRFLSPPGPDERARVARLVSGINRGSVFSAYRFQWSGCWVAFLADEHVSATSAGYQKLFDGFASLFVQIHEIAPLAEVVHANSTARGVGEWDRWTHEQREWPSSHPAWTINGEALVCNYGLADGYRDAIDLDLPAGKEDPAFDAILRAAFETRNAARAAKAERLRQAQVAAGKPTLVGAELPQVAVRNPAAGALQERVEALGGSLHAVSFDGSRALTIVEGTVVELRDQDQVVPVLHLEEALGVTYTLDGQIAVSGKSARLGHGFFVVLVRETEHGFFVVDRVQVDSPRPGLLAFDEGRLLSIAHRGAAHSVIAVKGGGLKTLKTFTKVGPGARVVNDEVFYGRGSMIQCPVNLDAAYEKWSPKDVVGIWEEKQVQATTKGRTGFRRMSSERVPFPADLPFSVDDAPWVHPHGLTLAFPVTGDDGRRGLSYLYEGQRVDVGLDTPLSRFAPATWGVSLLVTADAQQLFYVQGDTVYRVRVASVHPQGRAEPEPVHEVGPGKVPTDLHVIALMRSMAVNREETRGFMGNEHSKGLISAIMILDPETEGFPALHHHPLAGRNPALYFVNGQPVAHTAHGAFELVNLKY